MHVSLRSGAPIPCGTIAGILRVACAFVLTLMPVLGNDLDGEPSSEEELVRWHLNRGRFDSAAENERYGTSYTDVPASNGPLAPHRSLIAASRHHAEDMHTTGEFQHGTVAGSQHYDPETEPRPGDRFRHEGYAPSWWGENIAWGYQTSADAYEGWWHSEGHRTNMFGSHFREIGIGVVERLYAMGLGSRSNSPVYFTGTIFEDRNGNEVYDIGEGLPNVAITIRNQDAEEISTASGSFALPLVNLLAYPRGTVRLEWNGDVSQKVSIPQADGSLRRVTLYPSQPKAIGSYTYDQARGNLGFRDLVPPQPDETTIGAMIDISRREGNVYRIRWATERGRAYSLLSSSNLQQWRRLTLFTLGDGTWHETADPLPSAQKRYYRIESRPYP